MRSYHYVNCRNTAEVIGATCGPADLRTLAQFASFPRATTDCANVTVYRTESRIAIRDINVDDTTEVADMHDYISRVHEATYMHSHVRTTL